MARVPDCSNAEEFQLHDEGVGFGFKIKEVTLDRSANCPPNAGPDRLRLILQPVDSRGGRSNVLWFISLSGKSWPLKKLCEATGLGSVGGYDTDEFVGRLLQCDIEHTEYKGKMYANVVVKSVSAFDGGGEVKEEEEDDLPF